ncbi:enediyne biosynthesis protein UnbU [Sinosporangium siamense]|uniref:Uncharacterized protein n=1 Tax=Sinosporangium siamense TaxID=1367973 RepID=A0A919RF40_9ACTN|nr:enediyne biosynthesis protein UnbU [Sinosporangium siamense]GII92557.1 hypothetical protein Ssi02_27880 [Sinosporangium siamense]
MTTTLTEEKTTPIATGLSPARRRGLALRGSAASLTVVTVLGHTVLGFEQAYAAPVAAVAAALIAELVLESVDARAHRRHPRYLMPFGRAVDFFLPSYCVGLLCAMLLYGTASLTPTVLAAVVAVGSAYVVRPRCLNPVALGVVAVLVLCPQADLAPPYQFTAWVSGVFDVIVPLGLLGLGVAPHVRLTGRMPLILAWAGGFAAQAVVRGLFTDVSAAGALLPMTGAMFVLFTTFVIVDPDTTPSRPLHQVAFGMSAAVVYGLLVHLHISNGLFVALLLVCAARGVGLAILARSRTGPDQIAPTAPALAGARS